MTRDLTAQRHIVQSADAGFEQMRTIDRLNRQILGWQLRCLVLLAAHALTICAAFNLLGGV